MPVDKKYLIEIPGQQGTVYWGEERYNANKDALMKDHPDAIVFEVGPYSAEDALESDMFSISVPNEEGSALWDSKKFNANSAALLKDHPNAQIERVRPVDYWEEQRGDLKRQLMEHEAQYGDFLDEYEAKRDMQKSRDLMSETSRYSPEYDYILENAHEYGVRNKEREALRKAIHDNPREKAERESLYNSIGELSAAIDKESNEAYAKALSDYAAKGGKVSASSGDYEDRVRYEAGADYYDSAQRMLKSAKETLEAPSKYDDSNGFVNFMKGAENTLGSADFWSMGMSTIMDNLGARQAFEKIWDKFKTVDINELTPEQIDEMLTPGEKVLVEAFTMKAQADASRAYDLSLGYQSGKTSAESLGFMAQFLLTGGITSAATKAATKGAALWLAGGFSNMAKKGLSKGMITALKMGGKFALGTTKTLVDAAVRTGITTTAARSISEQLLPNIHQNTLPEANMAVLKGLGDGFIENWSEAYGSVLGSLFNAPFRAMFPEWSKAIAKAPMMKFAERAGFNGYLTEIGEEWFGNAMRTLIKVDPEALKNFATVDNQIITATAFLPMTLIGGGVSMGQMKAAEKTLENKAADLRHSLEKAGLNMDEIDALVDYRQSLSPQMLSDRFTPLITRIANSSGNLRIAAEVFKSASAFSQAVAKYQAMNGGYQAEQQNANNALRDEMVEKMGGNKFWNTRQSDVKNENGEAYEFEEVQVVTDFDGSRFFIVGQVGDQLATIDEDGKTGVITQQVLEAGKKSGLFTSDRTMMLDQFLSEDNIARRRELEKQRMSEERAVQVHDLRAKYPAGSVINLGTRVNPINGVVSQHTANGVVVQTEDKANPFIIVSYEQFAQAVNTPIRTLTDEQIAAEEAAIIEAKEAEKETELADTPEDMTAAEETTQTAYEFEQEAAPSNIPINEDGTVNEQKFLEESPEEYVAWNDNNRQDGGADSREQLEMLIPVYQNMYNEVAKDWAANAANPVARRAAKESMAEWQDKISRINALLLQYNAPAQAKQNLADRTVQAELEDLHDGTLNDAEIASNIDAHIAEAQSAYDEYAKTAPQMGTDRAAYKAAKAEYEARLKELEQELNYWNEVKRANENYGKILSNEESAQMEERRLQAIRDRVAELERTLGVGINVIERAEDVTNNDARAEIAAGRPPMGWFNVQSGKVDIFLPAVASAQLAEETIIHEVVGHKGLRGLLGEKQFNGLLDSVYKYMERNLSARELDGWLKYPGVKGDKRKAADEYLAYLAERVDYNQDRTTWDKIVGFIKDILRKIGIGVNEDYLVDLVKRSYARLKENATNNLVENGYDVDGQNGDVRFSSRYITNDSQREDIINSIVEVTGRTAEEAERWLQSEESVASLVLADKQYLDYDPDDKYKAIKDNSDYPQGTVDFNNICRKRIPFTKMYTRLQRRYPNRIFTAEELADIRGIMSEDGLTVACGLCYVEDRRQKLGEVADAFISDLKDGFKTYAQANATKQSNAAKFLVMVGSDSYIPTIYDLITLEGSDKLYNEHRGIWEAFGAYNRARGQQTQNTFQGYAEYKREILGWSKAKVNKVNSLGGLRVFSYSDFEAHHLLDLIQIIIDCAAKGVMIQGYTKVPEFARAVANTGIKLNRSLIPLGDTGIVDGQLAFDPVEGIDINDPNFLESNDNVGNILIGINSEQIRLAMADPRIHYIIPYHARQAGSIRAKLNVGAWSNYIDTQNERDAKTGKRVADNINIYTDILGPDVTNDREFVEKYLQKCAEMGRIPKFDEFLDRDAEGNYVYTPGYYKFLVDFKLFDENGNILPQKPVVAQFDDAFNMQILQEYAEGERETTGAQMNATYNKIVEVLGLDESQAEGNDVMFKTENIGDVEVTNLVLDSSKMDLPKTRDEAIAAIPKSGKICKAADGEEIRVSRRSVRHSVLHNNKNSYALFGVIDDVVANSVKIGEIPIAEDEIGKTNSVSVYYVPVNINGTQYSARIIVKETIHNEKILDTLSLYNVALHTEKTPSNTNVGESEETRVYSDSVKSAYKVKEIIHNSQAEDKKLVGIENETTFFKTAPRTDEQRAALFNAAKEEFGVTNNFGVAGYMLPDGTLLDFSEVKDGGPANVRTRDHREIGGIMEDREYDTRTEYITDFLNEGAIRIMPESDAINLSVAPSEEQRKKLLDYFYKKDGYIILELDNPEGKSVAYVEYDKKTSPYRIMRDIDGYFNEGIVPEQTTMFKTANNNQAIFVSNAAKAVEGIKMEKATPEQWMNMIEKNGGLKAGEDKWMGLSDFLKASDKKTLTKQEVLDFVNEHMIQIEEQHYGINAEGDAERAHGEISERLQDKFDNYVDEYYQDHDWEDGETDNAREYAIERLREEMGDTFPYTIELEHGSVYLTFPYEEEDDLVKWAEKTGVKYTSGVSPINDTRLNYTTDGLENKHEIALTVPTIESWNESDDIHFGDAGEGRAVAWIRFGDAYSEDTNSEVNEYLKEKYGKEDFEAGNFTEEDWDKLRGARKQGKKVLVIDEIQSKRHQEGREKGYRDDAKIAELKERNSALLDEKVELTKEILHKFGVIHYSEKEGKFDPELQEKADQGKIGSPEQMAKIKEIDSEIKSINDELSKLYKAIPDAPFDKNWHELAMKRMLRYAAENGYDAVAWTKGEQQAERYGIAKVVKDIYVAPSVVERYVSINTISGDAIEVPTEPNSDVIVSGQHKGQRLSDVVGKELADKILSVPEGTDDYISGDDLKVGGEGMKGFYDKMLPAFMNKYGKKWGVKVENIHLNLENGLDMHSVPVTEEMKESVMEGQTMFKTKQNPLDTTNESTTFAAITPEVRKEMDQIAAQAIANGNYLLAPNGKDTKLTPEQWALVRTKNFKEEYGDWEKDPDNVSIPLDENGEPTENNGEYSEDEDIRFKTRTKPAPTKTQDVYKLMRLGADGKLYPLFIGSAEPIELDTWYDAESPNLGDLTKLASGVHLVNNETGEAMTLDEFKAQHPEITIKGKRPNVAAINWATENGARWIEIEDKATAQRRYEGESRSYYNLGINGSGQVGQFAMRPGWHAGSLPTMRQIGKGKDKNLRDDSFVWVKGRIPADVDYQSEADANPDKDIPTHIPTDGFYMKATNANAKASQADKMGWYVAGSFIADEIISDAEARSVIDSWNAEHPDAQVEYDYERESGREFDPARGGLVESDTMFKTRRPASEVVAEGLVLPVEGFTNLAADIFKGLPEDMRRQIVDAASSKDWDLKNAIFQMIASLAKKSNLTDEEIEAAKMIADNVEKAAGEDLTRPLTVNEALWILYRATVNADERDSIAMAERAVVADNLGFSPKAREEESKDESEVRFKKYIVDQTVSAADAYTQAISYWGNRMNEAFVDQYDAVDHMIKAIEDATGKKAESWEDIRLILTQSASKGLAKLQEVERELIQKMWDAVNEFAKIGVDQERLARYVILKHGLERNEAFAKRDARRSYEEEYNDEVKRIKKDSSLTDDEKQQKMDEAKDILDNHLADIDARTDERYLENRKRDYSGILAMFADYPGLMSADNYSSEEEYRTARRKSRVLKHKSLAKAEDDAQAEVDAFESSMGVLVKNLWDSINKLTKGTLKMQHDYGMLSNDSYITLSGMFDYYVPLRGFSDNTGEDLYDYYSHNVSDGYAPPVMAAKGRKSEAESPFGWMAAMAATAVVSGEKNLAKQALYYFAMNRKSNDLLKIADVWYIQDASDPNKYYPAYPPQADPNNTPAENAQQYADWENQMEKLAKQGLAIKKTNKLDVAEVVNFGKKDAPEHVIKVNINGEEKQLIVNANPRAAQAINGLLNIEANPDYQKVLGKVLRWMSQMSTGWNPEFWMTNIARDTITAFSAIHIKEDKAYNEAFRKNWAEAWKLVKLLPKLKDGTLGTGRLEDLLREAVENGVQTGYSHIKSMEEWDKDMKRYLKELNKDEKKVVTAAKNFIDGVQTFSEAMELVSRFATYITSRQLGRDVTRSVADAKEVTVNFNRKGSGMRITLDEAKKLKWANGKPIFSEKWTGWKRRMGLVSVAYVSGMSALAPFGRKYMMFFNAGVQGLNMWLQMYRNGFGRSVNLLAGTAFALGILNSVLQGILDGDDDDYQQSISDYERRSNLMLGANGYYVKIALPQEIKAFYGLGDILYNYASGNYHHKDTPTEIFRTMSSQLVEILPINPMGGWQEFIPSMGRAVVEAGVAVPFLGEVIKGTNENFAGSPLREEKKWLSDAERESLPKYTFATDNTWSWLVGLAELANRTTGGSEYDAGWLQLDPARMQHYIEQATGGLGGFVGKIMSTVNAVADPEVETTVTNIPFINKVFTVADERGKNKLTNEQFYYYKGVADAAEMRYDKYQTSGDREKIREERRSDENKIMRVFFKYEGRDEAYKERLKRAKTKEEEKELKMKRDANRKRFLEELAEKGLL